MYIRVLFSVNRARASFRQTIRKRRGKSPSSSHLASSGPRMEPIMDQPGDEMAAASSVAEEDVESEEEEKEKQGAEDGAHTHGALDVMPKCKRKSRGRTKSKWESSTDKRKQKDKDEDER